MWVLPLDRQWGKALASEIAANPAFPSAVPGVSFPPAMTLR